MCVYDQQHQNKCKEHTLILEQTRADNVLWNKKKIMNIRRKMKRIYERLEEGGIE